MSQDQPHEEASPPPREDPDTAELLAHAQAGDREALDRLFALELPRLQRWASGRLPRWARDIVDTSDLIQETLLGTFKRLNSFELRGEGALFAYLRQGLINRLRNQLRRVVNRPHLAELESGWPDEAISPLEATIGRETLDRYEVALAKLSPDQRDAVVSRIEFGMTYAEIAASLDKPSADAARMTVVRALKHLTQEMASDRLAGSDTPPEGDPMNVRSDA